MRKPDDADLLVEMILAAEDALAFVRDLSYDDYLDDQKMQLALAKLFEIIGEAAMKLSAEMRSSNQHVPWADRIGMRHRLVHDYGNTDLELVWQTIQNDLPNLLDDLRSLVPPETGRSNGAQADPGARLPLSAPTP